MVYAIICTIMNNENNNLNKFGEAIIQKFINEEVMTKTELNLQLDRVMGKYVEHIDHKFDVLQQDIDNRFKQIDKRFEQVDKRFEQVDKRFAQIDVRYNWIIGLIVTATIGIISIVIKLH